MVGKPFECKSLLLAIPSRSQFESHSGTGLFARIVVNGGGYEVEGQTTERQAVLETTLGSRFGFTAREVAY